MDGDNDSGGSTAASSDGPNRCSRIIYFIWKLVTCIFTHVALVTMVVSYCLFGAVTFESLEREHEIGVKKNISLMRDTAIDDIWRLTQDVVVLHQGNWTYGAVSRIKLFENDLVLAMKKSGWDGSEETEVLQWTFAGALFYSIIVITTIGHSLASEHSLAWWKTHLYRLIFCLRVAVCTTGYGHIAPKTHLGKVMTIFYAVVGIPLMLLCLSNIGSILANSFRFLYWKVFCFACTQKSRKSSARRKRRRHRTRTPMYDGGPVDSDFVDDESMYYSESEISPDLRTVSRTRNTYPMRGERRMREQAINRSYSVGRAQSAQRARSAGRSPLPNRPHSTGGEPPLKRALSEARETSSARPSSVIFNKYVVETEDLDFQDPRRSRSSIERSENRRKYQDYPRSKTVRSSASDQVSTKASQDVKPVPIWLCVFLVVSYIVGGAYLFSDWEDWTYSDSAYFCFITLTTIGFGDFVPAQRVNRKNAEMSIALCSLYLLFGIALLAMSFNLVQEEVISNVKSVARHLGILKDKERTASDDD